MSGGARVLQVVTDDDRRGAQVFAVQLGEQLSKQGFDVETVALARGGGGGLDLVALGPGRRSPRTLLALRRAMAEADVTIAHGSTTGPMCGLASLGRRDRRRFVYRQIGDTRFWADTWRRRAQVRWFLRRVTMVVALSERGAASLAEHLGVPPDRLAVIPNGVPADDFPVTDPAARSTARARFGIDPDATVVAGVGSLTEEKGVDLLLRAAQGQTGVTALIAGSGPLEDDLRSLAADLGVDARFLGSVSDPLSVYAASDLLVSASHSEGMPGVLIEAGMTGLPVVATDVGFVADVVTDGVTGVLVPAGDVDALRTAIEELIDDEQLRHRTGEAAARSCRDRFSVTQVGAAWGEVTRSVTASAGARKVPS